jgi:TetR/AcrR family transcriptional regulator, regulator of autoinduction and epiphytic fitness
MATVNKRPYDMSNRSRQAAETRRRIVEAAARLFLRDGYAGTSMNAIAAEAGVAVPTVYASMRTKRDILEAVLQRTVRGEQEDVSLVAGAAWRRMEAEDDPRRKLAMFARVHRQVCEREAALFVTLEIAAAIDPEVEPLLRDKERYRYQDQERVARSLAERGGLRPGLSRRKASDVIWALASERVYLALVEERGWSAASYETWLADQLAAVLLPGRRAGDN